MSVQEEGVVEFSTTRGPVLGPSGFRRVTTLSGGVADLASEEKGGTPLYLWTRKSDTGPFVVNLKSIENKSEDHSILKLDETQLLIETSKDTKRRILQVLVSTLDSDYSPEGCLVIGLHRNLCLRLYTDENLAAKAIAEAKAKSIVAAQKSKQKDLPRAQQVLHLLSDLSKLSTADYSDLFLSSGPSKLVEEHDADQNQDKGVLSFVERALEAARTNPHEKQLVHASFTLAQTILRIETRILAGAIDTIHESHIAALRYALLLGGCVATDRIADLALSTHNSTPPTIDPSPSTTEQATSQQKSSRFFSRFSSSSASSSNFTSSSNKKNVSHDTAKPEARPLRRPQRAPQQSNEENESSNADTTTERLVQAACTRATRTNFSESKKRPASWPMDPVSGGEQEDDDELANNTALRFSLAVLKGGEKCGLSFFSGDNALAVRRAKEDTSSTSKKAADHHVLKVDESAGTGALLDYWAALGGLDALLARISPSSSLACEATTLKLLLDAIAPALGRARATTAPLMARQFTRSLQRAANARIRDLAADRIQIDDASNDNDLDSARTALRRCLAQAMPEAFVSARRALKEQLGPSSSEARGGSWMKQHVANYWGNTAPLPNSNINTTNSSSFTAMKAMTMIRDIRISAERLELEVASARLFRGDSEAYDRGRLLGVRAIGRIADAVLWAAQPYELRPRDVEPPPWVTADNEDMVPSWILTDSKLASWLARRDLITAIVALAVRHRIALDYGLSILCLAAQCGPFLETPVDAIASLCVHDVMHVLRKDEDESLLKLSHKTWVALAARLQPELVARQRDTLVKALAKKKPTIRAVKLVADFANVSAPRLLRAAAQAQQQQQSAGSPRALTVPLLPPPQLLSSTPTAAGDDRDAEMPPSLAQPIIALEGGLELLWHWTATDESESIAATRAGMALAAVLRRPPSPALDRPSLLCAERCVDFLSSGDTANSLSAETRVCRLLSALCVANTHETIVDKSEANYVHARRRALERKRGSLGRIAMRRAMTEGKHHAVLRLCLALAADAADMLATANNTPRRYAVSDASSSAAAAEKSFNRISTEDATILATAAGAEEAAAFFVVAAERRALEPAAAELALLELDAKCPATSDDARAAVALFELAANPNDMKLVDALVRLVVRAPIPFAPKSASRQLARICAGATKDTAPAARVADGCVRAVMKSGDDDDMARRAAGVLEHLFSQLRRLPPPSKEEEIETEKNASEDLVNWLAHEPDAAQLSSPSLLADDDDNTVEVRLASSETTLLSLSNATTPTPPEKSISDAALRKLRCKLRLGLALIGSFGTAYSALWRPGSTERNSLGELVILLATHATNQTESNVDATLDLALELLHAVLRRDAIPNEEEGNQEKSEPQEQVIPAEQLTLLINALLEKRVSTFPRGLALILLLARLDAQGEVLEALSQHSTELGTGLRLALVPDAEKCELSGSKSSIVALRGEAYALARDTGRRGEYSATLLLVTSLLTPLDNEPEKYMRQAYARCCEFVALLLDELRLAVQRASRRVVDILKSNQKTALTRVAERLAIDVVKRRADLKLRTEDEAQNFDESENHENSVRRSIVVDSTRVALYANDFIDNEYEAPAESLVANASTPHEGGTTVERARFALVGACLRCGARPSSEALIKCAHHLASRCGLLGYTPRDDALAPLDGDGSATGAATRSIALDALAALCEASGEALIDVCTAASVLHGAVSSQDKKIDPESVAGRLEAADVVKLAPSFQRLQTLAATGNTRSPGNLPPPPPSNQQRDAVILTPPPSQQTQRMMMQNPNSHLSMRRSGADFVAGAPPSARFSSVSVPAERPRHGYAGLDNLGCTCYLNSTIQMLVSTSEFRNVVLALDTDVGGPGAATIDATERQKLLLARELQLIVARLVVRDAVSISPRTFCDTFKWDGAEAIDVRQQQDASEFIATLFQQLEQLQISDTKAMASSSSSSSEAVASRTTAATHLEHVFGGIFAHELSALSDPATHTSRREETFYMVAVEVKDRKRIEEALEAYIAPEIVEYAWRDGGKRERTSKRVLIKKPPRHLLIHLKRFEFDLETLTQRKINSRFEFGKKLNLAPYMTENNAYAVDGKCLYELSGIVVHAGTAHSGHYYAFIKCKDNEWFEFNDSYVAPFDIDAELDTECFGGIEQHNNNSTTPNGSTIVRERTRNAFILSYHRIDEQALNRASDALLSKVSLSDTTQYVATENIALRRARAIFDESSLGFLATLVERSLLAEDADPSKPWYKAAAQLGTTLCTRTLVRARDDDSPALLTKCASAVAAILIRGHADIAARDIFLPQNEENAQVLNDALRRCALHPDEGAREALTFLFSAAFTALYRAGRKASSSVWSRKAKPEAQVIADRAARVLLELAATTVPSDSTSRNHYDDSFERTPQRVACDILALFLREEAHEKNEKARSWLTELDPINVGQSTVSTRAALLIAATTIQERLPPLEHSSTKEEEKEQKRGVWTRTTTRQLAAVATRVELIVLLGISPNSKNIESILDESDNALATLVAGCVALLDRGAYSKRVGDEARRRSLAARQLLADIVKEDARKSQLALSTIVALIERCQLGLEGVRRKRRGVKSQQYKEDDVDQQYYDDELLELDNIDVESLYDRGDDDDESENQRTSFTRSFRQLSSSSELQKEHADDADDVHDDSYTTIRHEQFSYTSNFLRRAWRALACVIAVEDSFRHWRVTKGLSRTLAATEQCFRCGETPNKLRICIEELLRLCKRDLQAREWVRSHQQACDWLLDATPEVGSTSAAMAAIANAPNPNPNMNNNLAANADADGSMGFVATSLDTLRAPLGAVRSWTERRRTGASLDPQERRRDERRNEDIARRVRILLSQQQRGSDPKADSAGENALAAYDSDDAPESIIGRRVKVRWAGGTYYCGTITKYDVSGHHVNYDDGDSRVYPDILAKTFHLL